jgi:hypothetical protein
MKKATFVSAILLLLSVWAGAQTVNVTFLANTATVPDTLGPLSIVQVRGGTAPLTWDGNSPVILTNIGGDYWMGTFAFPANTEIQYKFYTNAEHGTVAGGDAWEHQGWEGDVATGNRLLTTGTTDTTLGLQFVDGWLAGAGQYEAPYTTNDSTFTVWVRTNMQGWSDYNASQQIGLRGSNNVDWTQTGEISWGETYPLKRESNHVNTGSQRYTGGFFYSGAIHVPNRYAGAAIEIKVVVHAAGAPLNEDWGNMIHNPALQSHIDLSGVDTTVYWFWYDNFKPIVVQHNDVVVVTWNADMSNALTNRGFSHGDTLQVRSGYFGTASETRTKIMRRQGFSNIYSATDTLTTTIGKNLDYQYYLIKGGQEYREVFYNFAYAGETVGEAERRVQSSISGNTVTIEDMMDSQSDLHRMPLFRSTQKLTKDVMVTFTCDVRPAIYQLKAGDDIDDIQGTVDLTDPNQVMSLGVIINGPATGGWGTWGPLLKDDTTRVMFDDGTHGDAVAGDSIFTRRIQYLMSGANNVVGQEFKFGIGGGDNEGGTGGFGNNHIENIDDTQSTFTIASQFGSINPIFYDAWNFDTRGPATGIDQRDQLPLSFALDQNYPNPFNPSTQIRYQLAKSVKVSLTVYNLLGEKIATLVENDQTAGSYTITWNGTDNSGKFVGSGVYFYRIEAGDFVQTQKMILVK